MPSDDAISDADIEVFEETDDESAEDESLEPSMPLEERPRGRLLAFLPTFDAAFLTLTLLASVGFFAVAAAISYQDPDYFQRRLIASLMSKGTDSTSTGSINGVEGAADPTIDALGAPTIVRNTPLTPQDYEIVMVYGGEAILATKEELMRVKVGSKVPGLGEVRSIEPSETGGTVMAADATLRTVAN